MVLAVFKIKLFELSNKRKASNQLKISSVGGYWVRHSGLSLEVMYKCLLLSS
jgi:hypothetical protein